MDPFSSFIAELKKYFGNGVLKHKDIESIGTFWNLYMYKNMNQSIHSINIQIDESVPFNYIKVSFSDVFDGSHVPSFFSVTIESNPVVKTDKSTLTHDLPPFVITVKKSN